MRDALYTNNVGVDFWHHGGHVTEWSYYLAESRRSSCQSSQARVVSGVEVHRFTSINLRNSLVFLSRTDIFLPLQ